MKNYIFAGIAQLLELVAFVLYVPSLLVSSLSNYLYSAGGCLEENEEGEIDSIFDELSEEKKEEIYNSPEYKKWVKEMEEDEAWEKAEKEENKKKMGFNHD